MHEIMQVGVSVATMQVVFFAVHYVHDCLYSNYADKSFFYQDINQTLQGPFNSPFPIEAEYFI